MLKYCQMLKYWKKLKYCQMLEYWKKLKYKKCKIYRKFQVPDRIVRNAKNALNTS